MAGSRCGIGGLCLLVLLAATRLAGAEPPAAGEVILATASPAPGAEVRETVSRWVVALERSMPQWLLDEFFTLKTWQWLGILVLIGLGLVLDLLLRTAASTVSHRVVRRHGGEAHADTVRKVARPFGLFAAGVFWLYAVRLLGLPDAALAVLLTAARLFVTLAGVWLTFRLTDLLSEFFASKAAATETKIDDLLVPLLRKTAKIFVIAFGLIYIADSLRIEIAPLLAGIGIGGLGFAFAARDTLENFFGSVTVIIDRPFQIGDWVQIGDVEGIVENLGFRSTRIRTFYNSLITIPNGNLVRAIVDNFGQRRYRRWKTLIAVTYDTPPGRLQVFCEGIRHLIRLHPYTRKDYYAVWLNEFAATSLNVLLYVFFETPDWSTELRERHRLMLDIIRLADRLGVQFAFPTQSLHLYQENRDEVHRPAPPPEADASETAIREGRLAVEALTADAGWRAAKPEPVTIGPVTMTEGDAPSDE